MKKYFIALLSLFLFVCTITSSARANQYPPKPTTLVVDNANLLTPAERQALEVKLRAYEKQSTDEIAVLTVPSLNGESIESYSNTVFHNWGIGKKDKNNGILIVRAVAEHKFRIEVGYGLEGYLNDAKDGDIIRAQWNPNFKAGHVAAGFNGVVDALISHISAGRAEEQKTNSTAPTSKPVPNTNASNSNKTLYIWASGILIAIFGVITFFAFKKRDPDPEDALDEEEESSERATPTRPYVPSYTSGVRQSRARQRRSDDEDSDASLLTAAAAGSVLASETRSESEDSDESSSGDDSSSSSSSSSDTSSSFDFGGGDSGGGGATGDV